MSVSVSVFICLPTQRHDWSSQNFCACCLWPGLGSPLVALQYVLFSGSLDGVVFANNAQFKVTEQAQHASTPCSGAYSRWASRGQHRWVNTQYKALYKWPVYLLTTTGIVTVSGSTKTMLHPSTSDLLPSSATGLGHTYVSMGIHETFCLLFV